MTARAAHWRPAWADALAAARQRDSRAGFIGVLEGYCETPRCAVRTVELTVKESDGPTPPGLQCPACRRPLKVHGVQTLAEAAQAAERDARCSVNTQRYVRREAERTGQALVAIPMHVFLDESLPGEAATR